MIALSCGTPLPTRISSTNARAAEALTWCICRELEDILAALHGKCQPWRAVLLEKEASLLIQEREMIYLYKKMRIHESIEDVEMKCENVSVE